MFGLRLSVVCAMTGISISATIPENKASRHGKILSRNRRYDDQDEDDQVNPYDPNDYWKNASPWDRAQKEKLEKQLADWQRAMGTTKWWGHRQQEYATRVPEIRSTTPRDPWKTPKDPHGVRRIFLGMGLAAILYTMYHCGACKGCCVNTHESAAQLPAQETLLATAPVAVYPSSSQANSQPTAPTWLPEESSPQSTGTFPKNLSRQHSLPTYEEVVN